VAVLASLGAFQLLHLSQGTTFLGYFDAQKGDRFVTVR
jgi:hypothetical protein